MQEVFWEDNNVAIKYSPGKWSRQYSSMYHGSAVMRTREIGDSISVPFQGSAIRFMGAQGWDHGSFLVNLDGEETTVDGYCCGPNGGVPQVIQFEAIGLGLRPHRLNITNLATGPHGAVLEVDAFLITPHPEDNSGFVLSLAALVVFLVLLLAFVRRRLIRIAHTASYQIIPLASPDENLDHIAAAPPQPGVRPDKGTPRRYFEEPYSTAGASGSGHSQQVPPYYAPTSSAQHDDELVERIAQRLARLVHEDAPPTYETTTAQSPSDAV